MLLRLGEPGEGGCLASALARGGLSGGGFLQLRASRSLGPLGALSCPLLRGLALVRGRGLSSGGTLIDLALLLGGLGLRALLRVALVRSVLLQRLVDALALAHLGRLSRVPGLLLSRCMLLCLGLQLFGALGKLRGLLDLLRVQEHDLRALGQPCIVEPTAGGRVARGESSLGGKPHKGPVRQAVQELRVKCPQGGPPEVVLQAQDPCEREMFRS